jgi:uncharacterized protein (DUF1778 family)
VPEKTRDLVHEAADALGVTVSDFIAIAALHEAHKVLERERTVTVTREYASAFLSALDNPPAPNQALLTAAKRS